MIRTGIFLLPLLFLVSGCERRTATDDVLPPSRAATTTTQATDTAATIRAVCELEAIGESGVSGRIEFTQKGGTVDVQGKITGLTPGKHGFHVHEKGDLSDKETGKSAGGHFNPTDKPHGRPTDADRHVGDLGNIEADENGTATVDLKDDVIQLSGESSIVGLALMIHSGEDKFTQPAGDAGGRVAFGVIERPDTTQ